MVIVGIPVSDPADIKVKYKMAYNSAAMNRGHGLISGDDWAILQAFRAINQV